MQTPLVSVLLPAFDAAQTLGTALRSIERQTLTSFECVIVDDGSRDETRSIARAFAARDARFRVLEREHAGVAGALGAGLVECRGRYVARMDADDWMHRRRLELQVAALDLRPELAGIGAHVRIFPRRGLSDGLRAYERWLASIVEPDDVERERFVECPVVQPTLCMRRELLLEHGYRALGWPEDYDLVLRLLGAGHRLAVLPRQLLGWRDGPGRLTRTADFCAPDRIVACKAHHLARGFLSQAGGYVLWGYGGTGRALCRALKLLGKEPSAVVELHPGRIGQRIAGAPVIAPAGLGGLPRRPVVISVSGIGPRNEARERARAEGLEEGRDFVVAA